MVGVGAPRLRLIAIGGEPVRHVERRRGMKRSGGISAALDTLLSPEILPTPSSDSDEARRLLRIGGRLRELAEGCLDPAAPALERLGRTVELSGRRRLLAAVPSQARPSGVA